MRELSEFEDRIGCVFKEQKLLELALTHRSYAFEKRPHLQHNERLELLGDSVLGLIATDLLIKRYPDHSEGELSKARSAMVSEGALANLARDIELSQFVRLGKGEISSGGDQKPRLLAGAFEAIVGALYLDGGLTAAEKFVRGRLQQMLEGVEHPGRMILDYKTRLQELIQEKLKLLPKYIVVREEGPPHQKHFEVQVFVDSRMMGFGEGRSKKEAEQAAACEAIQRFQQGQNT